jgi:hypothetical protein
MDYLQNSKCAPKAFLRSKCVNAVVIIHHLYHVFHRFINKLNRIVVVQMPEAIGCKTSEAK